MLPYFSTNMNETTEHFFRDIAERVGYDHVAEVHLFPTMKQGGVESGLAIVATNVDSTTPGGVERHVVYTARYRSVLKGPDRGKWESDVKAEADAPLITIDEVVRGVVRRSGDEFHPERITGEQFRSIVPAPEAPPLEPVSPATDDTPPPDSVPE
jgi:hypothetical protein